MSGSPLFQIHTKFVYLTIRAILMQSAAWITERYWGSILVTFMHDQTQSAALWDVTTHFDEGGNIRAIKQKKTKTAYMNPNGFTLVISR